MFKKIVALTAVTAVLLSSLSDLNAQDKKFKFGVKGGFNYTGISGVGDLKNLNFRDYAGFNVGVAFFIKLPASFVLQPEILFYQAGSNLDVSVEGLQSFSSESFFEDLKVKGTLYNGNLYIPLNLQWGPQLGIFRPFVEVSPFLGFALYNRLKINSLNEIRMLSDDTNRLMGGIGAGGGVDIWKLQLMVKYNWNFNKLFSSVPAFAEEGFQDAKMRGLEISVGFMF